MANIITPKRVIADRSIAKSLLAILAGSLFILAACGGASGTAGGQVSVTLKDTSVVLDRTTVPAGPVSFKVHNGGTSLHEVVVVRTDLPVDKIPAEADNPGKMSEDGSQGESGDLTVGQSTTFTLNLAPGRYVLMCNQPGHYLMGMRIAFNVN